MTSPHSVSLPDAPVARTSLRTRWLIWSVPAWLGALYAQRMGTLSTPEVATWQLIGIALATWYSWVVFTPLVERLADRWPLREQRGRRSVLHILAAMGFCALQATTTGVATWVVRAAPASQLPEIIPQWLLVLLPAGVVVYGAVVALRHGTVTRVRLDQRERQAEQLTLALRDAQLTALRAQLQPHFLFNTLTAITALVRDGETTRAASALEQLSALLRDALRATEQEYVTLDDELTRIRHYLRIEELRLGRAITLTVDIAPEVMASRVPAWILQPLVENSVRHGFRLLPTSGRVTITATRDASPLRLTVVDDGAGLSDDWERRATVGYGLSNCRARLAALHQDAATLRVHAGLPRGTVVALTIPQLVDAR